MSGLFSLASAWWDSLSGDQLYVLWLVGGVVWFGFSVWLAHVVIRGALGHVRFRGTWYDARQFQTLLLSIQEDVHRGNRVMRHDEMALLRRWRFGSARGLSDGVKGIF